MLKIHLFYYKRMENILCSEILENMMKQVHVDFQMIDDQTIDKLINTSEFDRLYDEGKFDDLFVNTPTLSISDKVYSKIINDNELDRIILERGPITKHQLSVIKIIICIVARVICRIMELIKQKRSIRLEESNQTQ